MAEIVVFGGNGRIGALLVDELRAAGRDVVAASRSTGVDVRTGGGLGKVLDGTSLVIDVTRPTTYDAEGVADFFIGSAHTLMDAERLAGIRHHIALSIVGSDRVTEVAYYRAKRAAEQVVRESGVPYTIVHATQFFEFAPSIADSADTGGVVLLPAARVRPIAARDVADALVAVSRSSPRNGDVDIAGPEELPLDDFVRRVLSADGDDRVVTADAAGRYFGGRIDPDALIPHATAQFFPTRLDDWFESRRR